MRAGHARRTRPAWHPDAKWIIGVVLFFVVSTGLAVYNLVQLTAAKPAINILATALALGFSPDGLDDDAATAEWQRRLAARPEQGIEPVPGLNVTIFAREVSGLSPRETRLVIFRRVALTWYLQGPRGLDDLVAEPRMTDRLAAAAGVFGHLTLETHKRLQRWLLGLGALAVALVVPLILFSYGFGRLASPGWVLTCAAVPGLGLLFWARAALPRLVQMAAQPDEGWQHALYRHAVPDVWPPLIDLLLRNYLYVLAAGIGLVILARIGSMTWRSKRH